MLVVNNLLGTDTIVQIINIDVLDLPNAVGNQSCTPSSLELYAESFNQNSNINWYDSPFNGNLIYSGNTFTTDFLDTTTLHRFKFKFQI